MSFDRTYIKDNLAAELHQKNSNNPKVHGLLTSYQSHRIFDSGWQLLKDLPLESEEADIIIAGMAIWRMAFDDRKYHISRYLYPQHSLAEIFLICFKTDDVTSLQPEEIIKTIGKAALIEQKLGFDGTIPMFSDTGWQNRDWSDLTDRFAKYNLSVPLKRAEVIYFLKHSPAYNTLLNALPTFEFIPEARIAVTLIKRQLPQSLTMAELADNVEAFSLDKKTCFYNTAVRMATWTGGFFSKQYNSAYYFIQLHDEVEAYMALNQIEENKPVPTFAFGMM